MDEIPIDALKCFCTLAEVGSFGKAAERLGRSQPALSQRIRKIELLLGDSIYDRQRRCLTTLGKKLYPVAKEYTLLQKKFRILIDEITKGHSTELKIGTSDTFAEHVLPKVIKEFIKRCSETQLSVITRSSDEIEEMVLRGDLNIGIVTLPVQHKNLKQIMIRQDPLVLAVPKNHPLAHSKRLKLNEVTNESFITINFETRTGKIIERFLKTNKIDTRNIIDGGSFHVIMKYVSQGFGIAFIPEMVAEDWKEMINVVQLPKSPKIPYVCIYPRFLSLSKTEDLFVRLLKKVSK